MYITDARHFLDEKGAIGPQRGPAKVMAEFHASAIGYATDFDDTGLVAPTCFKCLARVIDDAAFGRLQCRPLSGVLGKSRKAKEF